MHSLYAIASDNNRHRELLNKTEKFSIFYHDIFDYPLTFADLIKWNTSENFSSGIADKQINSRDGYYFVKGRESLIYKRGFRQRISVKKMEIAKKASKILSLIPSIKMVAVTGSLAMKNSVDESDIDLMIITAKGTLWTTRGFAYLLIRAFGLKVRRPNDLREKDKLCLNLWMDESDLIWKKKDRSIYTAHEIAQILPLVNKDGTYEKFLRCNRWILKFWPNAVRSERLVDSDQRLEKKLLANYYSLITLFIEKMAFKLQYNYMRGKITKEIVTPTRAIFHPQDWGKVVLLRLNKNNGIF
jgi:D-beta-D-heptose 7-phosphate kinase/D-beta-D-heptose 1-phosphate adenosyltransferase